MSEKTKPRIREILDDPNKCIGEAENILSRLFRTILYDLNITAKRFEENVYRYLHDPHSGIEDTSNARNNHRGNLMKEIAGDKMSWGIFNRALMVLGVSEFEIAITIKRRNVLTKHVVFAQNNITYEEHKEDLSNANVVSGFEHNEGNRIIQDIQEKASPYLTDEMRSKFNMPDGMKFNKSK